MINSIHFSCLCKHVHLLCAFIINLLTYLLTRPAQCYSPGDVDGTMQIVKEKLTVVVLTFFYRALRLTATLVSIKQLLLQVGNLSVTDVNLLFQLHHLSLRNTLPFIRLHTVTGKRWANQNNKLRYNIYICLQCFDTT